LHFIASIVVHCFSLLPELGRRGEAKLDTVEIQMRFGQLTDSQIFTRHPTSKLSAKDTLDPTFAIHCVPLQPLCFIAFHCFMGCIGTYGCLLTWGQPYLFQRLSSLDSSSFYIFLVLELCAKDHLLQSSEIHVAHCSCVLHCVLLLGEKGGSFLKGRGVLAKVETEMRFTHYLSQLFTIFRNVVVNACETPLLINALRFIVFNCNLRQTCTCSGHTIAIGHMSIRMTITYELMRQYRHVLHIFLQLLTCRMSWWCPVDHSLYASKLRIGLATNHKFALWRATDSHLSLCLSWVLDPAWGN